MYCANCGESQENNNYCFSCGYKLNSILKQEIDLDSPTDDKLINTTKDYNPEALSSKILIEKTKELRSGSTGWIIFGFISALLGGPIGIAMGAHYAWWGKNYDKNTRSSGYVMMAVGFVCFIIFSNS